MLFRSDRITILVAETLGKRNVMTREIVLSMLLPGLLLTLVALGLLRKGIRAGLSPLGTVAVKANPFGTVLDASNSRAFPRSKPIGRSRLSFISGWCRSRAKATR